MRTVRAHASRNDRSRWMEPAACRCAADARAVRAGALVLEASGETLISRLLKRGQFSLRKRPEDASREAIEARLKNHMLQAPPMLDALRKRGVVDVIDASRPMEEVFAAACAAYDAVGDRLLAAAVRGLQEDSPRKE